MFAKTPGFSVRTSSLVYASQAVEALSSREVYENPWMRGREDIAEMPDGKTGIAVLHAARLHLGR